MAAAPLAPADRPHYEPSSLADALGGEPLARGDKPIRGGAVDSRRVQPGNAFFALAGERTNGHLFLDDAAARGAAALVVSERPNTTALERLVRERITVVLVPDTLIALRRAAAAWRDRFDPLVVGVTGSLAKTSTKEQVAEVLSERWRVLRNHANENNEIGLPLTLLRLTPEDEVAVLEMGMYEPGDIALLAGIARPRIGVVTAVRGAHLARAGSIEAIERGKRELVEALPPGGTAVLNADDPRVVRMAQARDDLTVLTYGFADTADVRAIDVESLGVSGMRFTLAFRGQEERVTTPVLGRHGVHNALAAVAVASAAGLPVEQIVRGLGRALSTPHRSALLDAGDWRLLDDSYNAAPDSMVAALDLLASLPGRHVAVLGEMLELGDESDAAHRAVGAHAARTADLFVAVGPMAPLYVDGALGAGMPADALLTASDRDQAFAVLRRHLQPGDTVLVKASRGAALDLLVEQLHRLATSETVA